MALLFFTCTLAVPASAVPPSQGQGAPRPGGGMMHPQKMQRVGPWGHSVFSASSTDGLTFTRDSAEPVVEHASVPAAMEFADGTIRIYFVDASEKNAQEKFGCVETRDGGRTYERRACRIDGMRRFKGVDFSIVKLPDHRYRLYYYSLESGSPDRPGPHSVASAVSTDGIVFEEEGDVLTLEGLVDPDVFWNGSDWVMHVHSSSERATVVAVSASGVDFEYRGHLAPTGYGVTKPVALPDGTFRMYAFKQPHANTFVSFRSKDGLTWAREEGVRFEVPESEAITDPFVILLSDGTYKMFYKRGGA